MPRLTQPVADWLLKTPEKPATPKRPLVFAPMVGAWRDDFARDGSTQQWLLDIQNHPEVEEEESGFEIINSRVHSGEWGVACSLTQKFRSQYLSGGVCEIESDRSNFRQRQQRRLTTLTLNVSTKKEQSEWKPCGSELNKQDGSFRFAVRLHHRQRRSLDHSSASGPAGVRILQHGVERSRVLLAAARVRFGRAERVPGRVERRHRSLPAADARPRDVVAARQGSTGTRAVGVCAGPTRSQRTSKQE